MTNGDTKTVDDVKTVASEALAALDTGGQIAPFSARLPAFDLEDAYRVTAEIRQMREARGEMPVGRKIGFTNRTIWAEYSVYGPMWGYVYDRTVHDLTEIGDTFSLVGFAEPRIEPEIVFKLAVAPAKGMDEGALLASIEWVAHGFEIVQSIFPGWVFSAPDTVAAFGLHGALLIGPRHSISVHAEKLGETLRRQGKRGCGFMIRIIDDYPIGRWDLKTKGGTKIGEWRAGGGHQSVIFGRHPEKADDGQLIDYKIAVARRPIEMRFEELVWPKIIAQPLPWEKVAAAPPPSASTAQQGGDHDANLDKRIRAYLARMPEAVSGQRGHDVTFNVACTLIQGWALSIDEARPYLHEYNARCKPPWSDKDLEHKLSDAVKAPLTRPYGCLRNSEPPKRQSFSTNSTPPFSDNEQPPPAEATRKDEKTRLILPSGALSFEEVAHNVFPVLADRRRCFIRDRLIVEIAYRKQMRDKQMHDVFQLLEPDAFRSRLEKDFDCHVWREQGAKPVLKRGRCTNDAARVLLKTNAAFEHLPTISFLSAQPVYTLVDGELKILYRGYHDVHGGIYVSHGGKEIVLPELNTAVKLILELLQDFDFVTESDKSRAVASLISPALRIGKFLGDADFPIDISEGDQSQSGKTFRLKIVCAIYGETPYVIANREGGVGSLDESISSAIIAGIPFILFENFRGRMNSQLVESCLRGTGVVPARIPHRGEVQVSVSHINWQLSSNGIEATRDFVNRSVINRISKRPAGHKFASYPEGNILAHIKANQPLYQGAIFRVIKQWCDEECQRTDENRHDFTEWAQTLDWIVKLFDLQPLLDGHVEEVLRVSDPALSWLRQIGIAVEKDNRLDEALSASEIVDICQAHVIDFPNKTTTTDLDQLSRLAGRLLGRVFGDLSGGAPMTIDRYEIKRESSTQKRLDGGGEYTQNYYWFRKRS